MTWISRVALVLLAVPSAWSSAQSANPFPIADQQHAAVIDVDPADWPGAIRAANDLASDIKKVTGVATTLNKATQDLKGTPILVGTIGKSAIIDALVRDKKIDVADVAGQWEHYLIQTVDSPLPGVDRALVIAGADKRGTIYGLYTISQEIGVSPWYWWADVPIRHQDAIAHTGGRIVDGPAVKYRGIFLNDEAPALTGWAKEKFGGLNSKMYTTIFELLLRLKANYLWPAMWGNAFNEDDPDNARLADEYGIVMGTSHQEAMLRAQKEFDKRYPSKDWNYATQPKLMEDFWREGIQRNKNYESIVTIGMRGRNDTPMIEGATDQQSMELLEKIVAKQREIIAQEMNPDVTKVPQMWCLYKEVQGYYEKGLRVPDDVTLLWSDDNWGDIRRLPTAEERKRSGGAGVYYHFDYVGDPRNYKWINTNPLPKIWEQMNLAYEYGADRIWIVNVGDLKPVELPISFFMQMGWNPKAVGKDGIQDWTRTWAAQQFGAEFSGQAAYILSQYAKFNAWRKPELLSPTTFSLVNYHEAERVHDAWAEITKLAEDLNARLPADTRDAFYQLALYPTKASATVVDLYIAAGRNALYAAQKRASTNDQAELVKKLFKQDQDYSDEFNHTLAGGKWNHMMDQTRIGYTNWQQPPQNNMPAVTTLQLQDIASMGVAVEGSTDSWPGGDVGPATLPTFDGLQPRSHTIELFRRGTKSFPFTATADQPWIKITPAKGEVNADQTLTVSIDQKALDAQINPDHAEIIPGSGLITISNDVENGEKVAVKVRFAKTLLQDEQIAPFGSFASPISILAESATKSIEANGVKWEKIPDYGRGPSAMSIFPVTAASVLPPNKSACLEYRVYLPKACDYQVDAILGPTMNFVPGRGLRLAMSFDDEPPKIVDAFPSPNYPMGLWRVWVADNAHTVTTTHTVKSPGVHTLKIWMVDPGVVLQSLIIHNEPLPKSYFGPPPQGAKD